MTGIELYRAGKLDAAIQAQLQEVKSKPADQSKRLFLFELLCFAGDLERAQRQLDALRFDDPDVQTGAQSYRKLLDSEAYRRRVFAEGVLPQFLIKPPDWLGTRLQIIPALRDKKMAEAARLLAEADQAAQPVKGTLNGKPFEGLRDCDDLFGPVLEVMAHGEYYWAPLEQVESLSAKPPSMARDLIWLPATLALRDGPSGDVFLPALYPNSHSAADEQVKLGRLTDWQQADGGPVRGVGLRIFLLGEEAIPLWDWRALQVS